MRQIESAILECPVEGRNLRGSKLVDELSPLHAGSTLVVFLRHFG